MEYERKAEPIGRELVRRLLPRRDPEGHKGTFGKVLCLCGSAVGNPVNTLQYLQLGLRSFSVSPQNLIEVKKALMNAKIK